MGRRGDRKVVAILGLATLGFLAYALFLAVGAPVGLDTAATFIYDGVILVSGVTCLAWALTCAEKQRGAWIAFGVGLLLWGAGDVYWTQVLADLPEIPYPSWADVGYVASIPFFFAGVALLVKHRVGRFSAARWLDGSAAALAAAALSIALLAPALVGLTSGDPAAVLTNLAYPIGDTILLSFLVGAVALTGVRGAMPILVLTLGLVVWTLADAYYLYAEATLSYQGGWTDLGWLFGALLIALAACVSPMLRSRRAEDYAPSLFAPALSALTATTILVWDHFTRFHEASIWLAGAAIVMASLRLVLSFGENRKLVRALHGEAITDALTGLGNRRLLLEDLNNLYDEEEPDGSRGFLFALFDLDGFKSYNDNFGHPAGDTLLQRLGANLVESVNGTGKAYRLGGDEFCVLREVPHHHASSVIERARSALSDKGEGFSISASVGSVWLPRDARDSAEALRMADQRMYEEKAGRSTRSASQTHDLLMRILREREPALSEHVDEVRTTSLQLGGRLALQEDELETIAKAAQLHDIGKIAIPEEILNKPAPLDDIEWRLMKRHTLIGERILGSVPGLREIGRLVRSSHERWDGSGYPDGLSGEEIPLGARIIFIADSFDAMTTDRPYSAGMSTELALEELRRCSGTQFDPELVEGFCELIRSGHQRSPEHSMNGNAPTNGVVPARSASSG
jgi:two-component system, cell cycle response regulator